MTKSTHTSEYRQLVTLIEETRKSVGLTQQEVACRLHKPQSYIAKVEGAERRIDVIEFIAFAKAYEIDPLELFKRAINKTKQ